MVRHLDVHRPHRSGTPRLLPLAIIRPSRRNLSAGKRIVRKVVNISSTSGVQQQCRQSNSAGWRASSASPRPWQEFGRYDVTVNAVAG